MPNKIFDVTIFFFGKRIIAREDNVIYDTKWFQSFYFFTFILYLFSFFLFHSSNLEIHLAIYRVFQISDLFSFYCKSKIELLFLSNVTTLQRKTWTVFSWLTIECTPAKSQARTRKFFLVLGKRKKKASRLYRSRGLCVRRAPGICQQHSIHTTTSRGNVLWFPLGVNLKGLQIFEIYYSTGSNSLFKQYAFL